MTIKPQEFEGAALIEFRNVTVLREGRAALDNVSLSIRTGEHVAILGPNGSGKSTLIKTITRECYPLAEPDSGVRILGRDRWNIFDLRPLLGVVSNDLMQACTRQISGREAVISGFFGSIGIWPNHHVTAEMEAKTDMALERIDIAHLAGRDVSEMSSGEARRVLIARALVHDPLALVLDEPSTSLDIAATHELRESISRLAASGTSVIVVTHHLPDIIPEVGRVVLLKDGRVYRDGPKEHVLTDSSLSDVFEAPVEVLRRDGYFQMW
jgi:iron complex transport system ATP-binding protein